MDAARDQLVVLCDGDLEMDSVIEMWRVGRKEEDLP